MHFRNLPIHLCLFLGLSLMPFAGEDKDSALKFSESSKDKVELSVSLPRKEFFVEEPILMDVLVTNNSGKDISYSSDVGALRKLEVKLDRELSHKDRTAKIPVKKTVYGTAISGEPFTKFQPMVLSHGKSERMKVKLTRSFDMSFNGNYVASIEFSYYFGEAMQGTVTTIKIENVRVHLKEPTYK